MNIKKILKAINEKFGKGNLVELNIMDDFSGELLGENDEQLLYFSSERELYDSLGIASEAKTADIELKPTDILQKGDKVHFRNGAVCDIDPRAVGSEALVELVCLGVSKVTRKAPKERELGPDELMQVGDRVVGKENNLLYMVIDQRNTWNGLKLNQIETRARYKVFRPIKKSRIPRKEWKRRCHACEEYLKQHAHYDGGIVAGAIEILKGNQP